MSIRCSKCYQFIEEAQGNGFTDTINIDQHGTLKVPITGNGNKIMTHSGEDRRTCLDCMVTIYLMSLPEGVNGILIEIWDIRYIS